jgi:uncharacterized protein YqhQ
MVGGQAVIEGVMMKSPDRVATSVRNPSGEIVSRVQPYLAVSRKYKILGLPIIRGGVNLFEQLALGIKALTYSAEVASSEEASAEAVSSEDGASEDGAAEDASEPKGKPEKSWKTSLMTGLTIVVALGAALLLFFWLPMMVANWIGVEGRIAYNVLDGAVRLAVFFAYLALLSTWKEMRRVFEYHGAEHKSIHAFEAGKSLTVENVKNYTTRHARCGTSFLLVVMVISIIVFIIIGRPETIVDRLRRLLAVPLIAGISYEVIRLAGKGKGGALMKIVSAPGLLLQRFTTREPSEEQIEVALDALKHALGPDAAALGPEVAAQNVGSN